MLLSTHAGAQFVAEKADFRKATILSIQSRKMSSAIFLQNCVQMHLRLGALGLR